MSWLKSVAIEKPKESVIAVLKKNLSGYREGRDRSQLHASDITKPDFCPRQWAINDLQQVKSTPQYLNTALAATYSLGSATAKLLIEEWAGESVVGNWECIRCGAFRSMTTKPGWNGCLLDGKKHVWEYKEVAFEAVKYGLTGSIDALFNLGTPQWRVTELKILAADAFDKILAPQPEHRIRTSLYLRLIDESGSVWRNHINLNVGTVLYVSRGYGRQNHEQNEILPFREYEVKRDDEVTRQPLQKALSLKVFREQGLMPSGICNTALDKPAIKCNCCKECFSGSFLTKLAWQGIAV